MIRVIGINTMRNDHVKVGNVLHLRIQLLAEVSRGQWNMQVEDVTPLPGACPTSYCCEQCGIVEAAKADGSPPEGWTERKFAEGSCFVCDHQQCQEREVCCVCGCTDEFACKTEDGPCFWVTVPCEQDICSGCIEGLRVRGRWFDDPEWYAGTVTRKGTEFGFSFEREGVQLWGNLAQADEVTMPASHALWKEGTR